MKLALGLDQRLRRYPSLRSSSLSNQEIGRHLSINYRTARDHVSNILTKLQVAARAQAIVAARDAGIGQPPP